MDDHEIEQLAKQSQALLEENKALLEKQEEVFSELRQRMAEQLGCSIWDLENMLERDLPAQEREALEQQAREMLRQMAPDFEGFEGTGPQADPSPFAPPSGGMPVPGTPRPRRRLV